MDVVAGLLRGVDDEDGAVPFAGIHLTTVILQATEPVVSYPHEPDQVVWSESADSDFLMEHNKTSDGCYKYHHPVALPEPWHNVMGPMSNVPRYLQTTFVLAGHLKEEGMYLPARRGRNWSQSGRACSPRHGTTLCVMRKHGSWSMAQGTKALHNLHALLYQQQQCQADHVCSNMQCCLPQLLGML